MSLLIYEANEIPKQTATASAGTTNRGAWLREMSSIDYFDLSDEQQAEVDSLANDTIPGGQYFFSAPDGIVAIECNLMALFEAQNQDAIDAGEVIKIVFCSDYELEPGEPES
jgi:hypothetical protein